MITLDGYESSVLAFLAQIESDKYGYFDLEGDALEIAKYTVGKFGIYSEEIQEIGNKYLEDAKDRFYD